MRRPLVVLPLALTALAALLAGLVLAVSAPAATTSPTAPSRGTPRHPVVVIKNFGFTGKFVVRPGVRVTVINRDAVEHTLSHGRRGHFDTGPIPPNGGVRHFIAPRRLGRFPFHCRFHPEMTGTLRVRRVRSSG